MIEGYTKLPSLDFSKKHLSANGINRFRYTEKSNDGKYEIFADMSYSRVRMVITETDGEKRQLYVPGTDMFDKLLKEMDNADMLDWNYIDGKDIEKVDDTEIVVEIRVSARNYSFGSVRMPSDGLTYLRNLKAIALSFVKDEYEVKPFKVFIEGKTYTTVRGTGNSAGSGAVIDFGNEKWWEVEHFVGRYVMTDRAREASEHDWGDSYCSEAYENAFFEIRGDGTVFFVIGDDRRKSKVSKDRRWGCYATAGEAISFEYRNGDDGRDKSMLEFRLAPEPAPNPFPGYRTYLERDESEGIDKKIRFCTECGEKIMPGQVVCTNCGTLKV